MACECVSLFTSPGIGCKEEGLMGRNGRGNA
jgi:hypothetical protein